MRVNDTPDIGPVFVQRQVQTDLTEREIEVLAGVASGQTSKEIAYKLGITERTVKAHLTSIYNKLGVDSRAAAVSEGMKQGLLEH